MSPDFTHSRPRPRLRFKKFVSLVALTAAAMPHAGALVDSEINAQLWKQKFGVLDAQMAEQPPYAGWLDQDADGDGVTNRAEFIAGTNPFHKLPADPHFRSPAVATHPDNLELTFPTVPGKSYAAESSDTLMAAWQRGSLPEVTGDGTPKTLTVPKSAGRFFRVSVTDRSSQGDQVSDWAKLMLGLSPAASIEAQTSFDHNSLASELDSQNVVSLSPIDTYATQPPNATTAATDLGVLRITRSGFILVGDVTVPVTKSGTAVEGVDYAPIPSSFVFPEGVNSLDVRITPLHNPARTSPATVFLTASAPDSEPASGNFTLGNPASAGLTIYPAANPSGTGLTANYYPGASSSYSSPLNFSDLTPTSYNYTRLNTTSGTAVITYSGFPATPIVEGNSVSLQFTSGNLNTSAFNTLKTYTVVSPVTSNSFTVNIAGSSVPSSGTGSSVLGGFRPPVTGIAPVIDFTWGYGSPNGIIHVAADNYSATWEGWLSPATAGNYVFRLDADDKARILIDTGSGFQQILENGWDTLATNTYKSSAPITLAIPASPANRYPIRVEFVETTGTAKCKLQWQINGGTFVKIPSANIFTSNSGSTPGWNGVYYNNTNFTPPAARTQIDVDLNSKNNGDWLTGSPDPLVHHDYFSCRWTGQILPQYSQKYYFVGKANEGFKLWVNNQLLLDHWTGAAGSDRTATIDLQANVLYDIRMESYETTSSSEAHLSWYSQDQAKQIIPTHRLFPTMTGSPAITSPTDAVTVLGSGSPFTMNVTSSNGGTISASGLPPWLTLANGVLSGTPAAAGIYQFTLTTTNGAGTGSAVMTVEVEATPGQLTRELWTTGVTGPSIANVPWTSPPASSDTVPSAEDNTTTYGENTGERLRGYFTAPVTGNYYFWIAASNTAELWISNNAEAVNKVRRATVTGAGTPPATWNAQPNQKSRWLSLVAGAKYYLEALHNTGSSGANNHLSVAWFVDPTGTTANPIANGCPPATAAVGGIMPGHVLAPWDNPPTTTVPGHLFVTNLQGVDGLSGITATGGAFLRVNGNTAVLQLQHSGLTSGVTSREIVHSSGTVLFDINAQDKTHPALKTSDGGYTWNMQPADLTALNNGDVHIRIGTVNHPAGEVSGTFGRTAGSQTSPPKPAYPAWTDLHATSDAANSRFLTQASFGPSPSDMAYVKSNGYRPWIENQFTIPPTKNVPFVLANLSNDPQNAYGSSLMFNSWWKNSVTAPDQLRQRAAFALSEILVVSNTGPLNNNGRALADYYDTLLDSCFGNYRDILKQVTLSPAMGAYLDMRGNALGNIQTGLHPNENYAREILQLFSTGLYRVWPDATLVLDSSGNPVPTYDQSVVTGYARVFTGWTWGQKLVGGRLPTSFSPSSNYLDPMVLVANKHELGSKILLDNVVLPPATVVSQSDTSTDPSSTYTVQSTDPVLGPGNLVTTTITNRYDLNGVKDLEDSLDNILENSATGPYICRQLIQRLVTSHPKPEYVHRVVRAFNGEQNVDGVATGIRGDMKEVFRAILLDYEARDPAAAADVKFGKQREPLLRITGPARTFPAATIPNSTYRQIGLQNILVTTPVPHRLANSESIRLADPVDSAGSTTNLPTAQGYSVGNTTPSYSLVGSTGIATISSPGYQAGDIVALRFTSGTLGSTTPYNTVRDYTVLTATATNFTINIGTTSFSGTVTGNSFTPNNFTVSNTGTTAPNYTSSGNTVTLSSSGFIAGHRIYLRFSTGGLAGGAFDGVYTIATAGSSFTVTLASSPPNTSGVALIPRLSGGYRVSNSGGVSTILIQHSGNHNLSPGDSVQIHFRISNQGTPAQSAVYAVTTINGPNSFQVTSPTAISSGSQGSSGMYAYPLKASQWTRSGTATVDPSTWSVGNTDNTLNQTPLDATTVFNFFYPDYQYPGEIAQAGMTTPEFQLTNDSNTMLLTNAITQGTVSNSTSNSNGNIALFGSNAVTMDLAPYMTADQTTNAAIPALVDKLGVLLTGGNLSAASKTTISNYATTLSYTTPTPTPNQIRDRVRAIVHLIVTSAEYAIQK
jgi:uncharacterized protein (DUF1800 family)